MDSSSMGVILDSSILIAGEKRKDSVAEILERVQSVCGPASAALSAVTAVELNPRHYRAKLEAGRIRRQAFVAEIFQPVAVHPLTLDVARPAGRIYGEQMGKGVSIDFPDLLIGATAIHLGFSVVTLNLKHFQVIPGFSVIAL